MLTSGLKPNIDDIDYSAQEGELEIAEEGMNMEIGDTSLIGRSHTGAPERCPMCNQ